MSSSDQTKKQILWDQRFLELCNHISGWSEDKDFQVGAVIVGPDLEIRSTGYNGFPRGVKHEPEERYDRPSGEKFFWFEHAERNAIYNAVRYGASLKGCTIYVNRYPCSDCTRAIIQSGKTEVCAPPKPEFDGALDHSFDVSTQLLSEADIKVRQI